MNEDGIIVFKMLALKMMQDSKRVILLDRTFLHVVTLSDFNNNVNKICEYIQHKIKIMHCGGEDPSSNLLDIFRIFKCHKNEEFLSLVQNLARLYDKGKLEFD